MLRTDDFLKGQILLEGWRQGLEYGGHTAALMVIGCIMNRVRLGWGSHLDVLSAIPKFSAQLVQPNRESVPQIWEPNFTRLLHEIEGAYDGSGIDYSKGAMYWCDLRRVETEFFKNKILSNTEDHPLICNMGTLSLFR